MRFRGIILLLSSFVISSRCEQVEKTGNVSEYLNKRFKETKIAIARAYMQESSYSVVTLSYDEKWKKLWTEDLNAKGALMIPMFNKMFILEDNRLMSVSVEPASTKTSSSLREVGILQQERPIRFVESIVWKTDLYLLVCYTSDSCNLFTGKDDLKMTHRQTIGHKEVPMDATFFTMEQQLYLVVANSLDPFPTSSVIYRWMGTYMDIVIKIPVGAVAVTVINYKTWVIIVLGLNEKSHPDVLSEIYEFKESGIALIQYLPTKSPTSLHHYYHNGATFLLTSNTLAPSSVYLWDGSGNGFLHWFDLPDVIAPKIINVAHINNDTLFFVSYEHSVNLYKVSGDKYSPVNLLRLKNDEQVVDMGLWIDGETTLTLLLVTVDVTTNLYRIEPWELRIKKTYNKKVDLTEADGATEDCLSKLSARLNDRMDAMENVVLKTWPMLRSATKNITGGSLTGCNKIRKLILQSASIAKLEVSTSEDILLAGEIKSLVNSDAGRNTVDSILEKSRNTVRIDEDNRVVGNVIIQQDAAFGSLFTDAISTENLNDVDVDLERSVISATKNQSFRGAKLRAKNIIVQNLEIDQLCGISKDYWLRNKELDNIFVDNNEIRIVDDSIIVRTDLLSLKHLDVDTMQKISVNDFLSDLFLIGERQVVKGNIIKRTSGILNINNLVVEELNGVSKGNLINTEENQNFTNEVFIGKMSIENLLVEKINGIPVSESAMVSKRNHVRGRVSVAVLRVSDELAIDNARTFPKVRSVQVYDEVTLTGNISVRDLTLGGTTYFALLAKDDSTTDKETSITSAISSHWTKSTSQIIENPVTFDAGASTDELKVKYLNNFNVNEDFMMTSAKEILQEIGSLEFKNFHAAGSIFEDRPDENPENSSIGLYEETNDTLNFNQEFRIDRLRVKNLRIKEFNGIPFDEIMRRNVEDLDPYEYRESVQRFDSVTVNDRFDTEDLNLKFVNGQEELSLDSLLQFDANYKIQKLKSDELTLSGDVNFIGETGSYIKKLINTSKPSNSKTRLSIDGELIVNGNLQVLEINDKSTELYLNELSTQDLTINSADELKIENLIVRHDLELNSLQGLSIESLVERMLSKSRPQNLENLTVSFFKVSVDKLETDSINQLDTRNLIYTDSYDIIFGGDVSFTNLKISQDEDVQTRRLNGYRPDELLEKLSEISPRAVKNLTVKGNIVWDTQTSSITNRAQIGPLSNIMRNGIVRGSENGPAQFINGEIRIDTRTDSDPGVFARRMEYTSENTNVDYINSVNLRQVVQQSVLDDVRVNDEIQITSTTSFKDDLAINRLDVAGDVGINALNTWRVDDLSSSIVAKSSLSTSIDRSVTSSYSNGRPLRRDNLSGKTMVFLGDVNIQKFVMQMDGPRLHGVPIEAIIHSSSNAPIRMLPNNTYLQHLEVVNNAFIKSLDSIDFDEFVNNRVTLGMDQEVHGNFQFNGRVGVTESATVDMINGIVPSDLVIDRSDRDEIITGEKIFEGDIVTHGNTVASRVAGVDVTAEYNNAVRNYESVEIFGDIIFEADVERRGQEAALSPTHWRLGSDNFVNGMQLRSLINDRETDDDDLIREIMRNQSRLDEYVNRAEIATRRLPEIFYYFEKEENLQINVANVDRVEFRRVEELTFLNMYAIQSGRYCGLEDDCPCRKQYVAEIRTNDCEIREVNGHRTIYYFHPTNGALGISVETTGISSSKKCTANDLSSEHITISWMKNSFGSSPGRTLGANVSREELQIPGYLTDAQVFTQNDLVFIVLAIYYDPIQQSHETNSLIYVLDLETGDVNLFQNISTNHAIEVQVFNIPKKGSHILFSSYRPNEREKASESLLYRFELDTLKFELLRSFSTGGNRHAKHVATESNDEFLILDDVATNSLNVYIYDAETDNFNHHQTMYLDSIAPITAIEAFYVGEYRSGQVYVIATTQLDQFFLFEYMFIGGFQLIAHKRVSGILAMVPFEVSSRRYIFVGTNTNSTVLRIVRQGQH